MALKNGKPNPLNYFELRRVEFACPHFKYTTIDKYTPILLKSLDSWIKRNLNNRYYLHGEFFDKITSLHHKSCKLVITNALDY